MKIPIKTAAVIIIIITIIALSVYYYLGMQVEPANTYKIILPP
jgi:hypothetical protein